MKYIILSLFLAVNALASPDYYYAEISTNGIEVAKIEFTSFADASNAIPDIVAEFGFTDYTAQVHKHAHYDPDQPNVPCVITPMANGEKEVIVETIVDTTHRLAEFVKQDCADEVDALKKANKIKKSKYFAGKETRTKVKDKSK